MEAADAGDADTLLEVVDPHLLPEPDARMTYQGSPMDSRVSIAEIPIALHSVSEAKNNCVTNPVLHTPVTSHCKRASGSKHALRQQAKRRRKNTTIAAGLNYANVSLGRSNVRSLLAQHSVGQQPYRCLNQAAPKVQTNDTEKHKDEPEVIDLLHEEEEVVVLPDIGLELEHDEEDLEEIEETEDIDEGDDCEESQHVIYGERIAHQSTMREVLASIPGFRMRRNKRGLKRNTKRSTQKLSAAAQLRQTEEGLIDLETPDSILVNTNLRPLLNKHTLSMLPPLYQHKLTQLLPPVDRVHSSVGLSKIAPTGLNNEFFARACHEWRERLSEGEFTSENQQRLRAEAEREKNRLDPWKLKHFEPIWGWRHRPTLQPQAAAASHPPESIVENVVRAPIRTTIKLRNTGGLSSTIEKPIPAPAPVDPVQLARRLRSDGAVTRAIANYRDVVANSAVTVASSSTASSTPSVVVPVSYASVSMSPTVLSVPVVPLESSTVSTSSAELISSSPIPLTAPSSQSLTFVAIPETPSKHPALQAESTLSPTESPASGAESVAQLPECGTLSPKCDRSLEYAAPSTKLTAPKPGTAIESAKNKSPSRDPSVSPVEHCLSTSVPPEVITSSVSSVESSPVSTPLTSPTSLAPSTPTFTNLVSSLHSDMTDVESGTNQRNSSEYPIETDVEGTSEGDGEKVENDAQLSYYNSNIQKRCREDDKNDTESCKRLRSCDIRQCSSSRQLISPETVGETWRELNLEANDCANLVETGTLETNAASLDDETEAEAEESLLSEDRTMDDVSSMDMDLSQASGKDSDGSGDDVDITIPVVTDIDSKGSKIDSVRKECFQGNTSTGKLLSSMSVKTDLDSKGPKINLKKECFQRDNKLIKFDSSGIFSIKNEQTFNEECKQTLCSKYEDTITKTDQSENEEENQKPSASSDFSGRNTPFLKTYEKKREEPILKQEKEEDAGEHQRNFCDIAFDEKVTVLNVSSSSADSFSDSCVELEQCDSVTQNPVEVGDRKGEGYSKKVDARISDEEIEDTLIECGSNIKDDENSEGQTQECEEYDSIFGIEEETHDSCAQDIQESSCLANPGLSLALNINDEENEYHNDEDEDANGGVSDENEDNEDMEEEGSDMGSADCDVSLEKPFVDASDLSSTSAPQIDSDWDGVDSSTEKLLEDLEAQANAVEGLDRSERTDVLVECEVPTMQMTEELEVQLQEDAFSTTLSVSDPSVPSFHADTNNLTDNIKTVPMSINQESESSNNSSQGDSHQMIGKSPNQCSDIVSGHINLELEVSLTPEVVACTEGTVSSSSTMHTVDPSLIPPTTIVCLPSVMPNTAPAVRPSITTPTAPSSTGLVVRAAGSNVVSSSALPYITLPSNTPLRALPSPQFRPKQRGKDSGQTGKGRRNNSSKPPPGAVNLERSYQICQAVIQNSPNRDQLRFQLKPPPSLLASSAGKTSENSLEKAGSNQTQYGAVTSSRGPRNISPNVPSAVVPIVSGSAGSGLSAGPALVMKQGKTRQPSSPVLVRHVFSSQQGIPVAMAVLPQSQNASSPEGGENIAPAIGQMAQYIFLQRADQRSLKRGTPPRASSAPPSNHQVISGVTGRGRPSSVDADYSQTHQQVYGQQQGPSPGVQAVTRCSQDVFSVAALPDHIPGTYPQVILHGQGQAQGSGGGNLGHAIQDQQQETAWKFISEGGEMLPQRVMSTKQKAEKRRKEGI